MEGGDDDDVEEEVREGVGGVVGVVVKEVS